MIDKIWAANPRPCAAGGILVNQITMYCPVPAVVARNLKVPPTLSALATVERHGPMRLGDVAAAEGIAPSTLTRLVTALEERAYVERCAVPGDARASTLTITTRGRQILQRIRQESTAMLAESLAMLPPDQIEVLAQALPALEQLAEIDPRDPQPR